MCLWVKFVGNCHVVFIRDEATLLAFQLPVWGTSPPCIVYSFVWTSEEMSKTSHDPQLDFCWPAVTQILLLEMGHQSMSTSNTFMGFFQTANTPNPPPPLPSKYMIIKVSGATFTNNKWHINMHYICIFKLPSSPSTGQVRASGHQVIFTQVHQVFPIVSQNQFSSQHHETQYSSASLKGLTLHHPSNVFPVAWSIPIALTVTKS